MVRAVTLLILVHHHIQPPMQSIFPPPMGPHDLQAALFGQRRAEQIVSGFMRGFAGFLTGPLDLCDGCETWPVVLLLQPVDIARDHRRASLDPPIDRHRRFAPWRSARTPDHPETG